MILPITIYGNPALRKVSADITPDYPNLKEIIANMWETMYVADGVGLAAPQVGLNIRLFVIDGKALGEDDAACADFKHTFINAKIIDQSGEGWAFNEGCLSLPGIREDVVRKQVVRLQYQDENFDTHIVDLEGIRARIVQHEYDHLEGKLFIDHINMLRRRLLKKKLSNIEAGDVETAYKVKYNKR
jgi:peptide deformylase